MTDHVESFRLCGPAIFCKLDDKRAEGADTETDWYDWLQPTRDTAAE